MKAPDLIQKRLLSRVELTLEPDGIVVYDKGLGRSQKMHVYFENIPPKSQELTVTSKKLLGSAVIVTVLALVCIPVAMFGGEKGDNMVPVFWGGIACVLWVAAIASRKSLVIYGQNNVRLVFFRDKPSAEAVDGFIKRLFVFRNTYLLKKYGRFSDDENLESKMNRLGFLRAQGVISDEVFEAKREEFIKGNKNSAGPLGFAQQ